MFGEGILAGPMLVSLRAVLAEAPCEVVLATSFPVAELTPGRDSRIIRVKTQRHLNQTD